MPTPHNEAKKGEIAKTVLMPGDPLRAKYIAENFLEGPVLVNTIRNMYCYTGTYKGKRVTVYCKFEGRTVEDWMGTSGYSFHSCHFGDHFVTS